MQVVAFLMIVPSRFSCVEVKKKTSNPIPLSGSCQLLKNQLMENDKKHSKG
jgi:hypothetical protein